MSLATYDLFTDEEFSLYSEIINLINEYDRLTNLPKETQKEQKEKIKELSDRRKELSGQLNALIKQHAGTPRNVRLINVLDTRKCKDENGELNIPAGITWHNLRLSKKIAEFESEESRAMGLNQNEVTFDKIILKWKFIDVLEQIVKDGFFVPLLNPDGTVTHKKYRFHTASAGQ